MKRTFLAMILVGAGYAVAAQEDSVKVSTNTITATNGNTMTATGEYNAYGGFTATAPPYVNVYVQRDYPAATNVRWRQTDDWWHGYYIENGQPMNVYYNNAGNTYRVALPVRQSLIPDEVVTKAVDMYGPTLYDITTIKGSDGQDVYHVRVIDNGMVSSQYIGPDGAKVIDVYRVETLEPTMSSGMNSANTNMDSNTTGNMSTGTELNSLQSNAAMDTDAKMKIKTRTSDGKETKTKIKNGKVKTKE